MAAGLGWGVCGYAQKASPAPEESKMKTIYDFTMKDIKEREVNLADYKGQLVLVVNVASKCGFTKQYAGLQKIYETYKDRGFVILAFPANNFLSQEPGTNAEIEQFCRQNYGVTFPVFAKISVKGSDQHPLYQYLTSKEIHPETGGAITWNFNKFLIGPDGKILARFGSKTTPESAEMVRAIEKNLPGK